MTRTVGRSPVRSRRRQRTSTPRTRWQWGMAVLAGFVLWSLLVRDRANKHGHTDWTADSPLPLYMLVMFVTYWPIAMVLRWPMYPADKRFVRVRSLISSPSQTVCLPQAVSDVLQTDSV